MRQRVTEQATLANDAPNPEIVAGLIDRSGDPRAVCPRAVLLAAWNSGKIVHRQVAIRSLSSILIKDQPLPPELEAVLLSAALDPDINVREAALGTLQARNHPVLAALAAEQFRDPDPQVRLLGVNQLKHMDAAISVPAVIPLLDDPDPMIISMALKVIEKGSGQDFGVKLRDTAVRLSGHEHKYDDVRCAAFGLGLGATREQTRQRSVTEEQQRPKPNAAQPSGRQSFWRPPTNELGTLTLKRKSAPACERKKHIQSQP